jgi:RNA polymerase sigma-70 factor (ECF subfamily)
METLVSDEELAHEVQQGKSEAFNLLFSRYEQKMLRYGRRFLYTYEDLEDAVQEVFIKAYRNIQSFQTNKKFSTWLYRIAHNTFINVIKKKGREQVSFFEFDTLVQLPSRRVDSVEDDFLKIENRTAVEDVLKQLSPKYREVLVLFYFEELGYKEIAEILKIPTSTVGVRIARAKSALKKLITH